MPRFDFFGQFGARGSVAKASKRDVERAWARTMSNEPSLAIAWTLLMEEPWSTCRRIGRNRPLFVEYNDGNAIICVSCLVRIFSVISPYTAMHHWCSVSCLCHAHPSALIDPDALSRHVRSISQSHDVSPTALVGIQSC